MKGDIDDFDPDYYLAANDDVRAFGFDPADHFLRFGRAEGRPANALQASRRLARAPGATAARASSPPLPAPPPDADPTLANLPAAISPAAMATHPHPSTDMVVTAAEAAADEDRAPGWFDADWYHAQNRDVRLFGLDPYRHYVEHGCAEGRSPNRVMAKIGRFSVSLRTRSARQEAAVIATLVDAGLVDANWYCEQYGVAPEDAIGHYVRTGAFLGFDPSPFFSTLDYIAANRDIATAGLNPLAHYIEFGFIENRAGVRTLSDTRLTTQVWLRGL